MKPQDEPQLQWNTAQALDAMPAAERALAVRLAEARRAMMPLGKPWRDMSAQELAAATIEAANWLTAARGIGLIP